MRKLKEFGGHEVCVPEIDGDVRKILLRGQLWLGDNVMLKRGEPCNCHENSLLLWKANKGRTLDSAFRQQLAMATGYALSEDGMWRQHSWCVLRTPRTVKVVETTEKRIFYFGYVLTEGEAQAFYDVTCDNAFYKSVCDELFADERG